ncbi:hypothetical protein ACWGKS_22145 [Nocardiopsis sp. NPDC055879]
MSGCCAPGDHEPTPKEERVGRIALAVILTVSVAALATVGVLALGLPRP